MLYSEKLILAKVETTEGTDALPVIGADLVRTIGSDFTPLVVNEDTLNIDQPYGGAKPIRQRAHRTGFTFPLLAVPSGTEGVVPEAAGLLRACGLAEVIAADTDVQYSPATSGFETASVYFNQSGALHKSLGFKGNLTLEFTQGQDPIFTVTGEGSYATPTEVPLGSPDFSGFNDPIEVNEANTTLTIGGTEFDMESLSFDAGLPQTFISRTMQTGIKTGDRQPSANIVITAPTLATKNFFQAVVGEGTEPVKLVHGTSAGRILELDLFAAQFLEPSYSESEGDLMMNLRINVLADNSGDDWRLTYK